MSPTIPSRRQFLHHCGLATLSASIIPAWTPISNALAAAAAAPKPPLPPLNRFPRMMEEWLVGQVRAAEAEGDRLRKALHTREDAASYVESVRKRLRASFGPEPERTPLNPLTTGELDRDVYRVEKVIFESRPGFPVTGNLYLPKRSGRLPCVLGVCGHSANGKAAEAYQSFSQGLARMGYVVLIFDPLGQGERLQYPTGNGKSRYGGGTGDHIQSGNPLALIGDSLAAWFAWDGVRALDYLLSRPEVDPKHVGVTGNSGGGTQTTWLCAVEPRFTMAAPSCFITTFRRNAENELPADTEQCPPGVLARHLDHSDFLAAMAPKPVKILTQEKDFFDVRGGQQSYERLKKLYSLLGQPGHIRFHTGADYHGYNQENREAMYAFFNEVTGISDQKKEPALSIEKDESLWCTRSGQVAELQARTVFSFTSERSKALAAKRKALPPEELRSAAASLLRITLPAGTPDYRILRSTGSRGYPVKNYCTYAVETEPGVHALVTRLSPEPLTSRPPRSGKRAILYVSHRSTDAELRSEALIAEMLKAEPDTAFFACDVRGIGESQPDLCGADQFLKPYGSDYFLSAHGIMLDRPYLGQRVADILAVLKWLAAAGHEEVHVAGVGWGALVATFAALLSEQVKQLTLKHALRSFSEIAETEDHRWPYAAMLPGVLAEFDLPECYAALGKRMKVVNVEPWSAADGMNET